MDLSAPRGTCRDGFALRLAGIVSEKTGPGFPWGTLVVNITGCLVIGFLDVIFEEKFLLSPLTERRSAERG